MILNRNSRRTNMNIDNLPKVNGSVSSLLNNSPIKLKDLNGLISSLIDQSPYDYRITVLIIVIIFLLIMILILCVICRCFCSKRHYTRLKDKINLKQDYLFGPNYDELIRYGMDQLDYNLGGKRDDVFEEIRLGQIRYSIDYNNDENIVLITIHEAKDIPAADISGTSDVFVEIMFKRRWRKKKFKTNVYFETLCPEFEETFVVNNLTYSKFMESVMTLQVLDYDRFGGSDLLGESTIPMKEVNLSKGPCTEWKLLKPEFKSEAGRFSKDTGLGHICIGLGYSFNLGFVAVFVLSCQSLPPVDEDGLADPYVTIFLVRSGMKVKKRKTTVKLKTLNPTFNERYALAVDLDELDDTSVFFVVSDYDKGRRGDPIGCCLIGTLGSGLGVKHWEKMRKSPGKVVCYWHMLKPLNPEP